ncbi:hypothetical protein TNCV_1426411 [Trichonephila clavipes]|nr:hypothetical protein TNCV_1426411 [Trichonephila clavipes]
MRDFTHAKNADIHYMYGHVNGHGRAEQRTYHEQFLINECRITEFFSSYNNFVKHVPRTSSDMMLVNKELYVVQA